MIPLCVDLDHTLLRTDLLHETLLGLFRRSPVTILLAFLWSIRGRAFLKQRLAGESLEISRLPYRDELLSFLCAEHANHRELYLVTAANETLANRIASHLQIFSGVIGSDRVTNVKGATKGRLLVERFGRGGFDYVGDSAADLRVWAFARNALVVSDSTRFIASVKMIAPVTAQFSKSPGWLMALIRSARPHQWAKSLLVFVPILTSHRLADAVALLGGCAAFVSFSLISSGVYLVNDLIDLESDRAHATKRARPLAAGQVSIASTSTFAFVILLLGLAIGWLAGPGFLLFIGIYLGANVAYSVWLKRVVMLDVVVLACFYTLRLLAGGAATGIGVSDWLLAFSVFFFFGLAMVKRYSELRTLAVEEGTAAGRGYFRSDLEPIGTFGVASGMISVLVLVLYVMSPEVRLLYRHPSVLLILCPLFLYWITRLWFKANRGEVPQDPVVFALTDRTSYIAGVMAAVVLYAASI